MIPPFDSPKSGYDSYYYDVYDHGVSIAGFTGPAYYEVYNAVWKRAVSKVAIFGWSHGGGATALFANQLELDTRRNILPNTFEIAATAYVDAVRYEPLDPQFIVPGTVNQQPENRRPLQNLGITKPHANWYQTNPNPYHGASIPGSDIDENLTAEAEAMPRQDHVNAAEIVAGIGGAAPGPWSKRLVDFFLQKMPTR